MFPGSVWILITVIILIKWPIAVMKFFSNTDPSSEQDRQDHDPIEAGSFVESDRIEKSWPDEKLVIRSLFHNDRIVSGIGPRRSLIAPNNTLRPKQNSRHFPDDIFKCIFFNENVWTRMTFALKFVPKCSVDNIPVLLQTMAWRRPGDKPLSEPIMVSLLTHICVTRPQWVNWSWFAPRG